MTSLSGRLWTLHIGDSRKLPMADASVHSVVTSPPYWQLRDYGSEDTVEIGREPQADCLGWATGQRCGLCHVCAIVDVFREVKRVLRDDGTLWLNYGDTYSSSGTRQGDRGGGVSDETLEHRKLGYKAAAEGIPNGNLCGIPWRVALALQADGWILRQDIIWYKATPMPEPVRNRCTKAHEYMFLLTKSRKYYYDCDAIRSVPATSNPYRRITPKMKSAGRMGQDRTGYFTNPGGPNKRSVWNTDDEKAFLLWALDNAPHLVQKFLEDMRNRNDVWRVSTDSFSGAHFATFPPKLIMPCILAGTSRRGACPDCGAPWHRVVDVRSLKRKRPNDYVKRKGQAGTGNKCANSVAGVSTNTLGWMPGCRCYGVDLIGDRPTEPNRLPGESEQEHELRLEATYLPDLENWNGMWQALKPVYDALKAVPCTVFDPFAGSGTTLQVARTLGRRSVGMELSEKYAREIAAVRIESSLKAGRLATQDKPDPIQPAFF